MEHTGIVRSDGTLKCDLGAWEWYTCMLVLYMGRYPGTLGWTTAMVYGMEHRYGGMVHCKILQIKEANGLWKGPHYCYF